VNVPIGIACALLAPMILSESASDTRERSFDIPGAIAVTAGLALLVYAVVEAVNVGWGATATITEIAGALALLVVFVAIELRQRAPLMPLAIFRLRTLRGADTVALLIGMSLYGMFFFVSLYMQQVLHYSALKAGIAYLPLAVGIILSAGLASAGVTRFGFKPVLLTGLLLIAAGLYWFSRLPVHGSFGTDLLGPSVLAALGLGFSFVPVTIAAVTGTSPQEAGLASGLVNTAQQVGGALGLAILATVANSETRSLLHGGHGAAFALTRGFDHGFAVASAFALLGALATVLLISSKDSREHSTAARTPRVPAAGAGAA
jgi:predicted MFS family arabinose efflux permease